MDTEVLATSAIKKRIAQTDYLSPYVNEKDKEPSWDGSIYAYNDRTKKKAEMFGRAFVQVKGVVCKRFKEKDVCFNMELVDLENYRKDQGILLFVVYIIETPYQERIFYSALTPFYLNEILKNVDSKKSKVKVPLKKLPDGNDDLCNIVFNFIRDVGKQAIVKNGHMWTLKEATDLIGPENVVLNFTYTGLGYEKNNPFSYLKEHEIYLYAQNKDNTISIPLHRIDHINMQIEEQSVVVKTASVEYTDKLVIKQLKNGKTIWSIGKGIALIQEEGIATFNYRPVGNLDEQILSLETVIDMIENRYLIINSHRIDFNPENEDIVAFSIDERKALLKYYKLIKKALTKLHVRESLDIEGITPKEEEYLRMLINAILFNKHISFIEKEIIPPVGVVDIANLKIVLVFQKTEEGNYLVEDFFGSDIVFLMGNNEKYPTTPFVLLQKDNYLKSSNMVIEKVIEGFKKYDNDMHLMKTVLCMLEMIKAYDQDETKDELLYAAEEICLWMKNVKPEEIIHKLNYLQCCKRKRALTDDEEQELTELITSGRMDDSELAGAYILLGNKSMARTYINKLDELSKKEFENYPIFTLYRRL